MRRNKNSRLPGIEKKHPKFYFHEIDAVFCLHRAQAGHADLLICTKENPFA